MNLISIASLGVFSALVFAAPSFAGSVGSQTINGYYRETVKGERQSQGYSQSQELENGSIRSQAIKVEFGGEPGFRGQASLGINNNGAAANCGVSANVDPYCAASLTESNTNFSKSTNSGSAYSEKSTFVGEETSHTVGSSASF